MNYLTLILIVDPLIYAGMCICLIGKSKKVEWFEGKGGWGFKKMILTVFVGREKLVDLKRHLYF